MAQDGMATGGSRVCSPGCWRARRAPWGPAAAGEALPQLGVALDATSVSGLSAGAYMAGQIEVAHSKDVIGAGIVAGGPFACAETASSQLFPYWPLVLWQNTMQAANACMQVDWGAPDADALAKRAKELAQDGKIDPLSGLVDDRVYLFSGNDDKTVLRPVVEAAKRFYAAAGVPDESVTLIEEKGGHAFQTETEGTACGLSDPPFVSDCDYDQAKAILERIYGPLAPPSAWPSRAVPRSSTSPASTRALRTGLPRRASSTCPPIA